MVYLHSPRVFHSLMVLSREPDTICLLSAEKATERTSFAWPTNRRVVRPDWISHNRRVPSHDPDLIRFISFVVQGEGGGHRVWMFQGGRAALLIKADLLKHPNVDNNNSKNIDGGSGRDCGRKCKKETDGRVVRGILVNSRVRFKRRSGGSENHPPSRACDLSKCFTPGTSARS